MVSDAGKIEAASAASVLEMISSHQPTGGNRRFPAFAIIPFQRDFRITQCSIIDMNLGHFSLKMPPFLGVHSKPQWMDLVVIASVRPGADHLIVEVKVHGLALARGNEVMPLTVAKGLRRRSWAGTAGGVEQKRIVMLCVNDPAVAHRVDALGKKRHVSLLRRGLEPE